MPLSDDDALRLRHMRDAANEVIEFTRGSKRADLDTNQMMFRAVSMSVGIIGEAASQISSDFRNTHQEFSWRDIIGMRNFLFHVYHGIDRDILWKTATQNVVALIPLLDAVLQSD